MHAFKMFFARHFHTSCDISNIETLAEGILLRVSYIFVADGVKTDEEIVFIWIN